MPKFYITLCSVWGILYIIIFLLMMTRYANYWLFGLTISFFVLAAISITSGIIGVTKQNDIFTPALINGLGVMIGIFIMTGTDGFFRGGPFWDIPILFSGGIAVSLITWIAALVTRLVITTSFSMPILSGNLKTIGIFAIIGLFYYLAAWLSSGHYPLFPPELFWREVKVNTKKVELKLVYKTEEIEEYILLDKSGQPFTGVIKRPIPKLWVNPFPATIKGVEFYKDGKLWGESEDPDARNDLQTGAIAETFDKYIQEVSFENQTEGPYYVHKHYNQNIINELKSYRPYIIYQTAENGSIQDLLSFSKEKNEVYRFQVRYYPNKMIRSLKFIKKLSLTGKYGFGWSYYGSSLKMDKLGFPDKWSDTYEVKISSWKKRDFIYTDFLRDLVKEGEATGKEKEELIEILLSPDKPYIPDHTYEWNNHISLMYNMAGLSGLYPEKDSLWTALLGFDGRKFMALMSPQHIDQLKEILFSCTRINTRYDKNEDFDTWVYLLEEKEEKENENWVRFFYKDGQFITRNYFYSLPIDNPEHIETIEWLIEHYKSIPEKTIEETTEED